MSITFTFGMSLDAASPSFAAIPLPSKIFQNAFQYNPDLNSTPTLDEIGRTYHRFLSRKTLIANQAHCNRNVDNSLNTSAPELLALTITLSSLNLYELLSQLPSLQTAINTWLRNSSISTNPKVPGTRFTAIIFHQNTSDYAQITLLVSRIVFSPNQRVFCDHSLKTVASACDITPIIRVLADNFADNPSLKFHSLTLD